MAESTNKRDWHEKVYDPAIKRNPERQPVFETEAGIKQEPVYSPEDLSNFDYSRDDGFPGEYPYTRGVQPTMYRGRVWTMRQYAGFSTAEESNKRYKFLLSQGQTGLSVAFDLPTQTGYDSDDTMALGEVGKVGVPIASLRDMEILFEGIALDKVSTSMTINATASILMCLYATVGKKQGVGLDKLDGTIQNDILKEYIARGTYIYPPKPSMRLVADVFQFCSKNMPKWNTISISGYHMREAGCTAAQEIAFTLADGIEYAQNAVSVGLDVDSFAGNLSFFFASHNNLLEEVAKFRAARRMWAKIMRERFHAKNPRSWTLRFHTQTAGVTLTAQQSDNNVIRCTMQALAAVLGGTQSLHVNSRDEALALPTEQSVQISLRTQQILASESGVADVADPLGGSYYIEALTNELEKKAFEYIKRIDDMGGALAALEQGFQQREIQDSAYKHQMLVEQKKRIVVGVNQYQTVEPPLQGIMRIDQAAARQQIAKLQDVRKKRDANKAAAAMKQLEAVARGEENTVPAIMEAVEAYCTIGEIAGAFRKVFGEAKHLANV
ncbi:MAG: methylmalonyl-CoA mutase [Dehalococcoidia bacterium]|nr:methylmalonyl-CoA mutase [Dehalococcoidia bacterium]